MIREGLLDSERYWSVTIEAQRLFFHMLLLADDLGCISVSPTFLRRRCFGDSPTVERISKLLNELIDVDLIRTYEVDRTCLAFIPRFGQRLQRETLKHPAPPESLYKDDADAFEKFQRIKNKTKNPTVGEPLPTVGQPPEEKRREVKQAAAGAATTVIWQEGLSLLVSQGMEEPQARGFLGMLCKTHYEHDVLDALQAAAGKKDVKSYVRAVLKTKPLKGAAPQRAVFD